MLIKSAPLMQTSIGIAGHNGVGHSVSHSGFIQDDSVGFAMLVKLLMQACPLNLAISSIQFESHSITIKIGANEGNGVEGGIGSAATSQVITLYEKDLMKRAIGQAYLTPQKLTNQIFGRNYGHGVSESAVAFNLAFSRAIADIIRKNWGETLHAYDNVPESCGEFLGGVFYLDKLPVSWLLTINSSPGGSGPNEDAEGMIPIGNKGKLIAELGMNTIPVIILESKAFVPALTDKVEHTQFFVRWNEKLDNPIVGKSLISALESLNLPYMADNNAYARDESLENETKRIGNCIAELGNGYAKAKTSAQKVKIAAELSKLVAQDLGGSIFMSSQIFKLVGGGGLWPGQSAVLSILMSAKSLSGNNIVITEESDLQDSIRVISYALVELQAHIEEAQSFVHTRAPKLSPDDLLQLIREV